MRDLDQLRRNVRVMDLLTESYEAHMAGDYIVRESRIEQALECDASVVSAVRGGMMIGELPRPQEDPDAWAEYVAANREKLARAEVEETGQDG